MAKREQERQPTADTLASQASKRVPLVVEPKLNKSSDEKSVPIADLDPQIRSALGIALMRNLLRSLKIPFTHQGPDYIAQFDSLSLKGGPYEEKGQQLVSLYLEVRDPVTNKLRNSVGVSNVRVPANP